MQWIIVYCVDYVRKSKIAVGTVVERRTRNRPGNLSGLLEVARKTYSSTPQEAFRITLGKDCLSGNGISGISSDGTDRS